MLLIAGGIGITPLRALLETIPVVRGDLTLIYRASHDHDIVFRREIERLAQRRGAKVWFIIGRRADLGGDPLTGRALAAHIPGLAYHDVYLLCGPPGLAAAVTRALRSVGVRRRQIHRESFEF